MMRGDASTERLVPTGALHPYAGIFGLVLFVFLAAACGGEGPCATKTCFFGVCDSESGQCVNKPECRTDQDCTAGFSCGQTQDCVPENTCESSDDCPGGICEEGACVNPDTCEVNSDCVPGTYCAESNTCEPDPCNSVTCDRGVCERGTGNCIDEDACDERLKAEQCDSGEKCLDDECVSREEYCDKLTCERGVCSFEQDGCVNADDCQGEKANCLEGYFCNAESRCQETLCDGVDCGDFGVCDPATGVCVNATECDDDDQCLRYYLCVEGRCLHPPRCHERASGYPGCPGNQTCEFDEETQTSECTEPEICETSIDCLDDRVCGGKSCLEPVSCRNDDLEPNDTPGEATDLFAQSTDGMVQASICLQNTDIYSVTTTDVVSSDFNGQIVATLTVPKRDVGLGKLNLTMTGPDGSQIGTSNFKAMPDARSTTLTTTLSDSDHGTYSLEVSPGDDVASNGIDYWFSVRIKKPGATAACDTPQTVVPGQRVSGDTNNVSATGLGSSCTSEDNPSPDAVYALELDRPQNMTIQVTPRTSRGDVTLSIRDRCRELATELSCIDQGGAGASESRTTTFSEGTYFLVVQAPAGSSLGPYDLTVEKNYRTTCGPDSNYCVDRSTAAICGEGTFSQVNCESDCNPTFGKCFQN